MTDADLIAYLCDQPLAGSWWTTGVAPRRLVVDLDTFIAIGRSQIKRFYPDNIAKGMFSYCLQDEERGYYVMVVLRDEDRPELDARPVHFAHEGSHISACGVPVWAIGGEADGYREVSLPHTSYWRSVTCSACAAIVSKSEEDP